MLFPCIVLIIIIQKRLRMNNIYYLFTGVRNDENIKFPRHSPSQMTIFNAFSSKGKVATLSMTRFFFKTKKTPHLTRQIYCKTISIGHQINLMICLRTSSNNENGRKTEYLLKDLSELYNINKEIKSVSQNVSN